MKGLAQVNIPGLYRTRGVCSFHTTSPHSSPHFAQGALELQRTSAGARQELGEDEKQRLWLKQAPWMTGHLNAR